jgi:hypothetical protein
MLFHWKYLNLKKEYKICEYSYSILKKNEA